MKRKKFLVCVLNWGMGHATRCIPVINELLSRGQEVVLASDGDAQLVLKEAFPQLEMVELPGYNPIYSTGKSLMGAMMKQMPKFLKAIEKEHAITEQLVAEKKIDVIISDNRYGCYSHHARSILMTHQVSLIIPGAFGLLEPFVNYYNRKLMLKFDRIWVPDYKDARSLTGNLSFSNVVSRKYIGHLSRFEQRPDEEPFQYDILGLVSGPEPQRQIFEDLLRREFRHVKGNTILVRGLPSGSAEIVTEGRHSEVNYMNAEQLNALLPKVKLVVSRSGYSTIMDLAKMGKRAIFVPTPGQTEQMFLAKRLMKEGVALMVEQGKLNLDRALGKNKLYSGFGQYNFNNELLGPAIEKLLK